MFSPDKLRSRRAKSTLKCYNHPMWPVLFTVGPVSVGSLQVVLLIALLFGLFAFWRKTREEHYDEMMVFDGVLLSLLIGFIFARLVFILTYFSQFQGNLLSWIDVFSKPGFNLTALFIGSGLYMFQYAKRKKWDSFEMLDFWSVGMSISMAFIWFGYWLAGISVGRPTNLPWGMVFQGLIEPHHPVQLYYVAFFAALAWYLSWVEYRYRTFQWYRANKNTAETGFLISMLLLSTGVFSTLMVALTIAPAHVLGIRVDLLGSLSMVAGGAWLLYSRSGQDFAKARQKRRQQRKMQKERTDDSAATSSSSS